MKKIYIILSLVVAAMMWSCTDDLDQYPVVETDSSKVYAEAGNYKMVLAKIYASYVIAGQEQGGGNADITSINGYDFMRSYFNLQEAGTDEIAYSWLSGNQMSGIAFLSWDVNDPWVADTYYRCYYTIALCNELIRHCSDSEISKFTAEEQAEIKVYLAEARFLRALTYYFVLDLFRQGPYVDENTPVASYMPEAYDGKQIFEYIESELVDNVENALLETNEYGRATRVAAWALLAKMYLNASVYTGEDRSTDCITYCKKIINSNQYWLEPEYAKLFNADNHLRTNEILFSFVVDATTTVSWGATTYIICGSCGNTSSQDPAKYGLSSGWGMFRVRGEYAEKFGDIASSTDSRCLLYTDGQTQYLDKAMDDQSQGYFSEKFTNLTDAGEAASSTQATGCSTDYPVFRLADVYLMAAEAVLRGGTGYSRVEALDFVNKVRYRAYGDESGHISDAQLTLDFILDERARELLYEATRRTDLIRYGYFTSDDYIYQWKGGVVDGRAVDSKYNIYPIPASELTANTNLKNANY